MGNCKYHFFRVTSKISSPLRFEASFNRRSREIFDKLPTVVYERKKVRPIFKSISKSSGPVSQGLQNLAAKNVM